MLKKIIRVLILISAIFSMFACNSSKKTVASYGKGTSVDSMDTISFGSYPQTKNGGKKPIKWIILEQKGGEILLLSKYILDNYYDERYDGSGNKITWDNCTLRKWLNEEFYNTAFNDNEKKKIVKSNIINWKTWARDLINLYGQHVNWNERSNDTSDYVYILSY